MGGSKATAGDSRAPALTQSRRGTVSAIACGSFEPCKEDVRILFGTDAPQQFSVPGFSIYREMQRMHEAGMTSYEILRTATANAGEYFEDKDTFGVIGPGRRADLVLLKANPLEDVANISQQAGVMVRGRWLSEKEIQSRFSQIATAYEEAKER